MTNTMNIAISGSTGFIGGYLTSYFKGLGYCVLPISREVLFMDDDTKLRNILSQSQIVINLAGEPINHFWTNSYKQKLYNSRIVSTQKIVNAINQLSIKPSLFISTSAIGYYPEAGYCNEYDEAKGVGFLPDLCKAWEHEAQQVDSSVRLVIARLGVVLAHDGGAFKQMVFSTKFKIATVIGRGSHLLSWISAEDLFSAINHIINTSELQGVVNLVSPHNITNNEMLSLIALRYRSWFKIRIPAFIFRLVLGEAADFLLKSPSVEPRKLIESGFIYENPEFKDFLMK